MESRVKVAGHPVHPMLVVFPLGLLSTAVLFDIIYLISDHSKWAMAAYYMIGAGVVGGLAAALFGWLDWAGVPRGTRAKRIGLWHGLVNVAVLALFVLSWVLRRDDSALRSWLAYPPWCWRSLPPGLGVRWYTGWASASMEVLISTRPARFRSSRPGLACAPRPAVKGPRCTREWNGGLRRRRPTPVWTAELADSRRNRATPGPPVLPSGPG